MYYLYAERYENIHDKSLMENIFGIWSIQGSVQGRFCSICTTFDLSPISLGRSCFNKTFFSYLWLTVKQKKTDKLGKMGRSFIKADGQEGTIEKRQCALSTRCLRPSTTLLRLPIHNYINSGESWLLAGKWVRLPSFLQSKDNYKQKSKQWDNEAARVELETNLREDWSFTSLLLIESKVSTMSSTSAFTFKTLPRH